MSPPDGPTVGVVGLGLIGGSLARAAVGRVTGVVATTRSPEARAGAEAEGIEVLDDVAAVVEAADVVVLAVPLSALEETLTSVATVVERLDGAGPVITDVGSVKGPIGAHAAATLADPTRFVGGHPMAGTEHAGWGAADPALFVGRRWALALDAPTDLRAWAAAAALATAVGAEVVPVEAAAHDAAVALVSHLPYAVAALAAGLLEGSDDAPLARALAAGSFTDLTRVAGGHPTLGAEMARANRAALAARLDDLGTGLAALRRALDGDDGEVATVFAAGRAGRRHLEQSAEVEEAPTEARLDRAALLAVGRRGGRVIGVGPGVAGADGLDVTVVDPGDAT